MRDTKEVSMVEKKKKLRQPLEIGEHILLLLSRIKKKDDPRKFYKSTVDNKSFFDKNIDNKTFYWIKNKKTNKKNLVSCHARRDLRANG